MSRQQLLDNFNNDGYLTKAEAENILTPHAENQGVKKAVEERGLKVVPGAHSFGILVK